MIHSFLLIGQSNMAGRGFLHEAHPINTENIRVLRNGRWLKMYRPVNNDRPFSGVCLAESFAEAYAKKHEVTVGLIPCADGGTCLDQWKRGSLLYDHAVYQGRLASRTSTIVGVLWHQGEGDAAPERYPYYEEKLTAIFEGLKADLGLENVPFLVGGLGDFLADRAESPALKNYPFVNAALRSLANHMPRTGFVSAEGLTHNGDYLHFNADALYQLGLRYFEVFEALRDPNQVIGEKSDVDGAIRSAMELL